MLMLFPQMVLLQLKTNVKRRASCCSYEEDQEDLAVQSSFDAMQIENFFEKVMKLG